MARNSEYQQPAFSRGTGAQPPTLGLAVPPGGPSSSTYAITSTHTATLSINQQSTLFQSMRLLLLECSLVTYFGLHQIHGEAHPPPPLVKAAAGAPRSQAWPSMDMAVGRGHTWAYQGPEDGGGGGEQNAGSGRPLGARCWRCSHEWTHRHTHLHTPQKLPASGI